MIGLEYARELFFPQTLRLVKSCVQGFKDNFSGCLRLSIGMGVFEESHKVLDT